MAAKYRPNFLFCTSNRTKCIQLISVKPPINVEGSLRVLAKVQHEGDSWTDSCHRMTVQSDWGSLVSGGRV
jgi:hypothetical protein